MPTWNEINNEIDSGNSSCDKVRHKYLAALAHKTGRPCIAYYSGWLQKKQPDGRLHAEVAISDLDVNGFMTAIHGLPRDKGFDLVLHTPGGDIEATRGIVEYLFKMFGRNFNVIVPQAAFSAGTMIACASKTIIMAKHSCLGPTDPQVRGFPAIGVINEIDRAIDEIKKEPLKQLVWQNVFAKYGPAFIASCERARDVTREIVKKWLAEGMMAGSADSEKKAEETLNFLMDVGNTTSHSHHFMIDDCRNFGLSVDEMEKDPELQEAVLSVHHAFSASFNRTKSLKIIQNSAGSIWQVGGETKTSAPHQVE